MESELMEQITVQEDEENIKLEKIKLESKD